MRLDNALFRWEKKTDGGSRKVMIQSNLAKLVDTMAAMSEMRKEGNERTLDVACLAVSRSFPQIMLLVANHIPAYLKHILPEQVKGASLECLSIPYMLYIYYLI